MTAQITPYFNLIGFQETASDAHLTKYSRTDAMTWACKMQVTGCVQGARNQYAAFMQDPQNNKDLVRRYFTTNDILHFELGSYP